MKKKAVVRRYSGFIEHLHSMNEQERIQTDSPMSQRAHIHWRSFEDSDNQSDPSIFVAEIKNFHSYSFVHLSKMDVIDFCSISC